MRPQRIIPTAFVLSSGQKRPRRRTERHLKWIRTLPCLVTGLTANIEAAHVRYGNLAYGKRAVGASEKPDDCWTIPLHDRVHGNQHAHGDERDWWEKIGIDPLAICCALWAVSGDTEAGELILKAAREKRK